MSNAYFLYFLRRKHEYIIGTRVYGVYNMHAYHYNYYIVYNIKRDLINRMIIIYDTARASRRDEENI